MSRKRLVLNMVWFLSFIGIMISSWTCINAWILSRIRPFTGWILAIASGVFLVLFFVLYETTVIEEERLNNGR